MSAIDRPDPAFEEEEADRRLSRNRRDAVAMLVKADSRMRAGDHRAANAYYAQVMRLAQEGEQLDGSELQRAGVACRWLADRFAERTIRGLAAKGITRAAMHPRFAKSLDIMLGKRPRDPVFERYPQLPRTYFYPDLPYVQFADPGAHPWTAAVEEQAELVLAEAQALLVNGEGFAPYVKSTTERPQGDVHGMLDDPSWSTLDLTAKGRAAPERVALCPRSYAAVAENAPLCTISNRAPSLMFSLLRAGSRIPPHTGMINARFVCHLPLIVPGDGALRVGSEQQEWRFGKVMLFDDTIEHEAWNHSTEDRLVLIFDIWRPELEQIERDQIRALFDTVDEY